ncbi:MAG: FAD binding domain-containing protein [Desulfotignum sp.]|nr:FAD binding domain-containing protein [Desulfotignum sp.]
MLPNFSYVQPLTVKDAVDALTDDAVICAGGSDLLGCMREGIVTPGKLVGLEALDPLKGITKTPEGGLDIGAMTTIAAIARNPLVNSMYPGLAQGARQVASPQLRNQGTIGGNLCQKPRCWYYRGEFDCLRKGGKRCYARRGQHQFHAIFGHDNLCWKQRDKNQPKSTGKNQPPFTIDTLVRVRVKPDSKGCVFRPEQRPG